MQYSGTVQEFIFPLEKYITIGGNDEKADATGFFAEIVHAGHVDGNGACACLAGESGYEYLC